MARQAISRSEGFPARDIWFLGVILPGHDQMERVLGKPPSPSPSLGNSGRHSGQETIFEGKDRLKHRLVAFGGPFSIIVSFFVVFSFSF